MFAMGDGLNDVRRQKRQVNHPGDVTAMGRICYGIELDPAYVGTAIRRWQTLTGDCAIHAPSGKTFDALTLACAPPPTSTHENSDVDDTVDASINVGEEVPHG